LNLQISFTANSHYLLMSVTAIATTFSNDSPQDQLLVVGGKHRHTKLSRTTMKQRAFN